MAVDVGYENPVFACLELDYSEADQDESGEAATEYEKMVTFYELDLGLNHVVRKVSEPIDPASNMLIPVPGDTEGPSGVLVCAENKIAYKKPDHDDVVSLIPRRSGMPLDQPLLIISYSMLKQKDSFFFLLQSELGDLYRLTLEYEGEDVSEIKIDYFDTVPAPCTPCARTRMPSFYACMLSILNPQSSTPGASRDGSGDPQDRLPLCGLRVWQPPPLPVPLRQGRHQRHHPPRGRDRGREH